MLISLFINKYDFLLYSGKSRDVNCQIVFIHVTCFGQGDFSVFSLKFTTTTFSSPLFVASVRFMTKIG